MHCFENISAVTFDMGGTLIKPWPSVGHVYAEVAARHGLKVPVTRLNRQFARAWANLQDFHHGRTEWAALVDQTFAGCGGEPPSQTFFPELYDRFREASVWHVFEDVRPSLDALAGMGLNLGVISNWDDRLRPLLQELGLGKYFEAIVISCEVGFSKPSAVIFEQAAKSLGAPPENILHVGDSLAHDVSGAKSAGFEAVHLARNGATGGNGSIASLLDLETLMAQR